MGAADQGDGLVGLGKGKQGFGEVGEFAGEGVELVADVQADVDGDLVVAAAAGVDLLAEVAQALGEAALDGEVDVLVGGGNGEVAAPGLGNDVLKGAEDGDALLFGEERGLEVHAREHGDVGGGAKAIDLGEGKVENRVFALGEGEDVRVDFANGGGGVRGLGGHGAVFPWGGVSSRMGLRERMCASRLREESASARRRR